MQHDSYDDAVAMANTIRDLLHDDKMLEDIVNSLPEKNRPPYFPFLSKKNGMNAIVMAQLLKAMGGDTSAAGFLAKYGYGDKLQVDVSNFYQDRKFEIEVVKPNFVEADIMEELPDGAGEMSDSTGVQQTLDGGKS
ncbi:MAG: hypothetical protein NC218_03730 [Acetobacter sp.]|nr:hypothetical protein [Acetobacter sp.]